MRLSFKLSNLFPRFSQSCAGPPHYAVPFLDLPGCQALKLSVLIPDPPRVDSCPLWLRLWLHGACLIILPQHLASPVHTPSKGISALLFIPHPTLVAVQGDWKASVFCLLGDYLPFGRWRMQLSPGVSGKLSFWDIIKLSQRSLFSFVNST